MSETEAIALNGVVRWVGHRPAKQKVAGLILGQDTCRGGVGGRIRGV